MSTLILLVMTSEQAMDGATWGDVEEHEAPLDEEQTEFMCHGCHKDFSVCDDASDIGEGWCEPCWDELKRDDEELAS